MEGRGLYLVLQPSGARAWAVRYRADVTAKKQMIGSFPLAIWACFSDPAYGALSP
jgi:hypothetical protein